MLKKWKANRDRKRATENVMNATRRDYYVWAGLHAESMWDGNPKTKEVCVLYLEAYNEGQPTENLETALADLRALMIAYPEVPERFLQESVNKATSATWGVMSAV